MMFERACLAKVTPLRDWILVDGRHKQIAPARMALRDAERRQEN